ncbi:MAG: hypothetical protein HUU38_07950 [Anaerolineales bacterium]|nr:hypothetical protein [Anaerolineales bacterium]
MPITTPTAFSGLPPRPFCFVHTQLARREHLTGLFQAKAGQSGTWSSSPTVHNRPVTPY